MSMALPSRSHASNGHGKHKKKSVTNGHHHQNGGGKRSPRKRNRITAAISTSCWIRFLFLSILFSAMALFYRSRLFDLDGILNWEAITQEDHVQPTTRKITTTTTTSMSTTAAGNASTHNLQVTTITTATPAPTPPPTTPQPAVKSDPHHHAILIPYRDRAYHLERFLEFMRPYLQRHFPDDTFTVYVIEQNDESLFNRGWLTNVGLAEIKKRAPETTCVVLHDVDLIPNGTSHVPYTSCAKPIHLAKKMENFGWAIPYIQYCGGITSLSLKHWEQINGMSNDYLGWGGEDDDLWHRIRLNGLLMSPQPDRKAFPRPVRPDKHGWGHIRTISQSEEHHTQQKEHNNKKRIQKMLEEMWRGSTRWQTEGWNDVYYQLQGENTTLLSTDPMDMPDWQFQALWVPPPKNKTDSNSTNATTTTALANPPLTDDDEVAKLPNGTTKAPAPVPTKSPTQAPVPTKPPTDPPTHAPTQDIFTEPKGPGIDKVVHIQAASRRSRNQLPPHHKLATTEPLPILELFDIPHAGNDLMTRAAARANIVWGACHYYNPGVNKNHYGDPYECSKAQDSGNFNYGLLLEASYHQAQFPWHLPPYPWATDPLEGTVRFTVVKNPYTRALDFFRTWYDTMHKGTNLTSDLSPEEYIRQREQPAEVNYFLKAYLEQTTGPWVAQPWMRGVFDMMPMYDIFSNKKNPWYVKHILKYETLEKDWHNLAVQYNYTDMGIGEQLKLVLEEKRAKEANAKAWLQPEQLEPETLDLINTIFQNDFMFDKGWNKTEVTSGSGKKNLGYKHPRTKNHKQVIGKGPLELVAIPYTGASGALARLAGRANIVWGACHFDMFEDLECPPKSGDFRDSQKIKMNGQNEYETPWNVQLRLWTKNPYSDISKPDPTKAKTFAVVRNPYDRVIAFYRHMFDRQHGHARGIHPRQDEDALLDMGSVPMDEYLRKREDPGRLNAFLQAFFVRNHNPHKPHGMDLVPQSKFTTRVHHVVKYEALVSGLQKQLPKYNFGNLAGKKLDLEALEKAYAARANFTRTMNLANSTTPRWLRKNDLSDETVAMVNEIYMFDFYKWYRLEKRVKPGVDTSRFWRQPHAIPGQTKKK